MGTESKVTQLGWDNHKNFSTVSARDASGRVVSRERLGHADRQALRDRLRQYPPGTPVVLEGTFGWGWASDEIAAAGLEPHLAGSSKVAGWREARGMAKSNKRDADLLSELWGEKSRWWEIWLAPAAVREQREWLRYRMALVRMQTGLKNRVHAVLHRHGVLHEHSDLFGSAGRKFLEALAREEDATLPQSGRDCLRGYLKLLEQLRGQIAAATRQFRKQVKREPAARRLMTLPGVSWVLAYTILAEVGKIERFKSGRHLASYSCLTPRAYDSGEEDGSSPIGRHVGHAGRRTLKWAWIEAAHGAVRKGGRFKLIFDRRTNGGKRDKNRGYIAVAHQLCKVGYVLWDKEVEYSQTPPPRPGRRQEGIDDSRSGTGQPDRAMVAAASQERPQASL
jgi:transposase